MVGRSEQSVAAMGRVGSEEVQCTGLRGRVESPNVPLPYTEILIQQFGPKRVTQLLNYDIIEFPEEGYLLHFKLEFPEGENQLLYLCAY